MNEVDEVQGDDILNIIKMVELNRFNRGNEALFKEISPTNEERRRISVNIQ